MLRPSDTGRASSEGKQTLRQSVIAKFPFCFRDLTDRSSVGSWDREGRGTAVSAAAAGFSDPVIYPEPRPANPTFPFRQFLKAGV
jgi:hypothetical protein